MLNGSQDSDIKILKGPSRHFPPSHFPPPSLCLRFPQNPPSPSTLPFAHKVGFTVIGRKVIKVLFIGSDSFPSPCGPACKTTHAATLTQEPHYPISALYRVFIVIFKISLVFFCFLTALQESQIDENQEGSQGDVWSNSESFC